MRYVVENEVSSFSHTFNIENRLLSRSINFRGSAAALTYSLLHLKAIKDSGNESDKARQDYLEVLEQLRPSYNYLVKKKSLPTNQPIPLDNFSQEEIIVAFTDKDFPTLTRIAASTLDVLVNAA